jgi:hypothetical protein
MFPLVHGLTVPAMMRMIGCLGVLLSATLLTGCVERRFVIESVPPGAQVLHNGREIGHTVVDEPFVYYGMHDFTLIKDGYETLHIKEKVHPPWYEYPGLDFIFENLIPFPFRDIRRLQYQMQPLHPVPPEVVLPRAIQLQQQGRQIGDAPPTPPEPVPTGGVVGAPN